MMPARVPVYPLQAAPPQLLPLSEAQASSAGLSREKKLLIVVVVILAVVALLWWLDRREKDQLQKNKRTRVRKQSTAAMAKNLYQRLQDRGGVDETTMRSLAQLSRNA